MLNGLDFQDVLEELEHNITIIEHPGEWSTESNEYVYQSDPQSVSARAVILPLTNDDIQYGEGGTYTRHDRKIYIHRELEHGQKIIDERDSKHYTVQQEKDYSLVASGLRIYFIVRVGGAGGEAG